MREEYRHPLAVRLAVVVMCIGLLLCAPLPLDRTVLAQTTQNPMAAHEIVILIDKSSSIRDLPGGMQTFKDAGKKFLRNILKASSTEKRVAIVAYDWEDVGVKVYKELTTLTDSNLPELVAAIDAIPPPGSWTGTARAIDAVCDITQSEPGLGFMLHLTDGCANRPVGQEEGKRAAEEAYDHFKVNCSLVGIVGVNLDPEAEEHLRKMASPGLFSSVQIDENSVDPGYDIAQAMTQVAYGVGETDVRIAVLDSDSEPEYFTGELKNSVEAALQVARSRGFKAQPITPSEIAAGLLYSYDTLVLPDNAPPADVVSNIMAWWIGGGHIVAIDSGLTFILYAGMLFPELADKHASFSEGTYWSYDSSNATTVQKGHPVTAGHTPGEQIAAVARDALLRIDKLPSGAQVLAIDAGNADWATVVFYQGAGSLTFIGPSDDSFALAPIIGNAMALDVSSMGIVPDAKTLTVAAVQGSEEEWLLVREEFQSQHPNVEIELIYLPEGALFPRIEASFREGHPFADVVMVYRDWVPDLIDRGVLLDLSVYKDRFVKERVLPIEYNGIPIGVPWASHANWYVCVFQLSEHAEKAVELMLASLSQDVLHLPALYAQKDSLFGTMVTVQGYFSWDNPGYLLASYEYAVTNMAIPADAFLVLVGDNKLSKENEGDLVRITGVLQPYKDKFPEFLHDTGEFIALDVEEFEVIEHYGLYPGSAEKLPTEVSVKPPRSEGECLWVLIICGSPYTPGIRDTRNRLLTFVFHARYWFDTVFMYDTARRSGAAWIQVLFRNGAPVVLGAIPAGQIQSATKANYSNALAFIGANMPANCNLWILTTGHGSGWLLNAPAPANLQGIGPGRNYLEGSLGRIDCAPPDRIVPGGDPNCGEELVDDADEVTLAIGNDDADEALVLWQDIIYDDEFAIEIDALRVALAVRGIQDPDISVMMEQCFSGGFITELRSPRAPYAFAPLVNQMASACQETKVSWACDTEGLYDEFLYYFVSALNGADPFGGPLVFNPDANGDGVVSWQEAFDYARLCDNRNEIPQFR